MVVRTDADVAVLPLQTAHTDDIIHGITPNVNGAKYMLILKHHFNRPDKEGVVRLSKELVEEAVASQRAWEDTSQLQRVELVLYTHNLLCKDVSGS